MPPDLQTTTLSLFEGISAGAVIHVILLTITIPRVLTLKRESTTALAWIFGALLLPIIGSLLFWVVGDPEVRSPLRKIGKKQIHRSSTPIAATTRRRAGVERLQRLLARLGENPSTIGNGLRIYTEGKYLFDAMERALAIAEHEICVQSYIFADDEIGRRMMRVLMHKAQTGVRVYLMYDAIGSKDFPNRVLKKLRMAGVEVHPFLPFSIFRRRVQINFRNHRKLLVVDRRIAFTGGFNIGAEYAGRRDPWRHWFDAHMGITGRCVEHLHEEFAADWAFVKDREKTLLDVGPHWQPAYMEPHISSARQRGWLQIVSSGPDQPTNRTRQVILLAITRARERVWILTPYFVPDDAIFSALQVAALSGVDVRIVTQGSRPDHWIAWAAARYYYEPLMDAGVRFFHYNPGMMHAKVLLSDSQLGMIGSANIDVRSLALNFELSILFYSAREINMTAAIVEKTFAKSTEIGEAFRKRRLPIRMVENCARLFQPVL